MTSVSLRNTTRQLVPRFDYHAITDARLSGWELSVVFVGRRRAQRLNETLRGMSYTPNVLSYEVGPRSGEIIICPLVARQEAAAYGHTYAQHVAYLFIHGILHLEGWPHGATMERWEQKLLAQFAGASMRTRHESTHRNRH